jgi:surfactin synthase thioesterase subunit
MPISACFLGSSTEGNTLSKSSREGKLQHEYVGDSRCRVTRPGPWLKTHCRGRKRTLLRLLCWPYAGAGASIFRSWAANLPGWIDVLPLHLPGREERFREAPFQRIEPLIEELARSLEAHIRLPFAFFGHSMGALIAFEMARKLRSESLPHPVHLFVSGARPPHEVCVDKPMHTEPDQILLERLLPMNGIPEEVLRNPELRDLVLPTLRADVELCETYIYAEQEPLSCPITAFGGCEDKFVPPKHLEGWEAHTRSRFRVRSFFGGHFYLNLGRQELLREISEELLGTLAPADLAQTGRSEHSHCIPEEAA